MKISNFEFGEVLGREQLKTITGGAGGVDVGLDPGRPTPTTRPCSVYDTEIGAWVSGYSVADAQWMYNNDDQVTGYCCASC